MSSNAKQYGLIMPKKANQGLVRPRPSVFNDSDAEEEESGGSATDWVKKALKREAEKSFQKKQNQIDMQKALEEDPTVYQYDEVYDKIEEKKAELISAKKQQEKKPRYIQSLLLQAEKRKREQERRNERLIQKEREAEGDMYKDKEAFVTSAYREKLEEFKKMEEEEKHQDEIEALTDVSKQKDLSGFYRHLYRVKMGETEVSIVKQEKDTLDIQTKDANKSDQNEEKQHSAVEILEKPEKSDVQNSECVVEPEKKAIKRQYRNRRGSSASSGSNSQERKSKKEKPSESMDADSDFSVESDSSAGSSSSSTSNSTGSSKSSSSGNSKKMSAKKILKKNRNSNVSGPEKESMENAEKQKRKTEENDKQDNSNKKSKTDKKQDEKGDTVNTQRKQEGKEEVSEKQNEVPKQNIWLKRTVGDVFEKALQRYYERKSAKFANKG